MPRDSYEYGKEKGQLPDAYVGGGIQYTPISDRALRWIGLDESAAGAKRQLDAERKELREHVLGDDQLVDAALPSPDDAESGW